MKITKLKIVILLIISGALGFLLSFFNHKLDIENPVQVIETFHYPALFVKQLENDKEAGRKIFKEFCSVCHANPPQIDIKAPHIGNKKVWKGLAKLGMPALLKITIDGVGAMPARGGCFECSDQQLVETIRYILDNSK